MAQPNSTFTQALSASIANYRDSAADDVTGNNALLALLAERGNVDPYEGGVSITEQVLFDEVDAAGWYSGSEQLSVQGNDVLTTADYAVKQFYSAVIHNGLEERQNMGESEMIDLVQAKIDACMATAKNAVGTALFNSNTENDGKAIGGLQHLVSDSPSTPTVGGIDASSSDNAFWRNYVADFSALSLTPGSDTVLRAINTGFVNTNRGSEMVDILVAGDLYWGYFESALQANQRFIAENFKVKAGFKGFEYKGATAFHDPHCNTARIYGLNSKFLKFRPDRGRNFKIADRKDATNQDVWLFPMYFHGNLTVSSRKRHFVVIA